MASYPPTAEVIADFLRLRQGRGQLVVAKLARHLGLSGNALSEVAQGKRDFPMKNLDATAEFFGVDAPDFIHLARREVAESATRDEHERLRLLKFQAPPDEQDDDDSGDDR